MEFKLEEIPSGPHLIDRYQTQRSGVDYLNLRQVNLDLMARCIPGTNNVTRFVRPYSLMCWVYWIYPKLLKGGEADSEELRLFREKVESLHLWGHMLEGVSGLPGTSSKMPDPSDGKVGLSFKEWGGRQATNTSLQAAVQYGPSLLDLGGIGFLHKVDAHFYQVTDRGEKLAVALDAELQQSPYYSKLVDLGNLQAGEEEARDLFHYWRIDDTSSGEREAFRSAFWNPEASDRDSLLGRRSATVQLILNIIAEAEAPLQEQQIRDRMGFPRLWGRLPESLSEGPRQQSRLWVFLQFRQLQRLALESVMGWLEGKLLGDGGGIPDKFVKEAHALVTEFFGVNPDDDLDKVLEGASTTFHTIDDYLGAREADPGWFDLNELLNGLLSLSAEEDDAAFPQAFFAMLLLFNCRPWMESDPTIKKHLHDGGAARVSLGYWIQAVDKFRKRPFRDLIDWMIKNLIVSQHFAVGTNRFDGERIRLRIVLEEDGLESLVGKPWHPNITPDRLAALLSLMDSCGLIREESGHFTAVEG